MYRKPVKSDKAMKGHEFHHPPHLPRHLLMDFTRCTHTSSTHTMADTVGVSYYICSKASIPGCQSCIWQYDRPTHMVHMPSFLTFPFSFPEGMI